MRICSIIQKSMKLQPLRHATTRMLRDINELVRRGGAMVLVFRNKLNY